MDTVKIAVIGGGLMGLSTAVCISESIPQCSVTVISEAFSPNTTSDVAAGVLIPHKFQGTPIHQQINWFKETFDYLFSIYNSAEASDAGIILLSGLKRNGGQERAGKVQDVWELYGQYDIVVNCAGLGSRELFGDKGIYPVQGQVLKVHAPWLTHFVRDGSGSTYIYPGISSVTLGGTRVQNEWSLKPDSSVSKEIFRRCTALVPSLEGVQETREKVGLRPTRPAVRLEREVLLRGGQRLHVVHNYGHGGGGFSVHRGTAKEATRLVEETVTLLSNTMTKSKL
ncbi:D-aspartate oxidase isoform X2 [Pleurodeles waltl]|uniref:D-aspartate oxidase isoform X2 n=1 Tax=Pleurodeles waltl TaxID=8319 RepID=UPI003709AC98